MTVATTAVFNVTINGEISILSPVQKIILLTGIFMYKSPPYYLRGKFSDTFQRIKLPFVYLAHTINIIEKIPSISLTISTRKIFSPAAETYSITFE